MSVIEHFYIIIAMELCRKQEEDNLLCWKKSYISNIWLRNLFDKDLIRYYVIQWHHSFFPIDQRKFGRWKDTYRTHRRICVGYLTRVWEGRCTRFPGAKFRSRTHGVSSAAQRYGFAFRKRLFWYRRGPKVERHSIVRKNTRD